MKIVGKESESKGSKRIRLEYKTAHHLSAVLVATVTDSGETRHTGTGQLTIT